MTVPCSKVRFPCSDREGEGGECVGDLYLPPATRPAPVVVMAHGLGAQRSFGLDRFALRFADRGLAVLVFDYRHLGESPGEPRNLVVPSRQLEDYRAALRWVRSEPRVDGGRVALWGTSFSGGHVLVLGAEEGARIRAIVSQIPFVSGISSALAFPLRYHVPAIALGLLDTVAGRVGASPLTTPVARPRGLAVLPGGESYEGYESLVPAGAQGPGRLPARVFLSILTYRPISIVRQVTVPTLIIAARDDRIIPIRGVRRAAARIPDCRLEEWPIGHFELYAGDWFERAVSLEADFLAERLQA